MGAIRRARLALLAVSTLAVLAACSNTPDAPAFVEPPKHAAELTFSHPADAADVSPADMVTVSVRYGSLETVTLNSNLGEVPGVFATDYTSWHSAEDLD